MAINRTKINELKPLEVLAAFVGYFAVAKDVPEIFRMLSLKSLIPPKWINDLLKLNSSPDFWYLIFFSLICAALVLWFMRTTRSDNNDVEDVNKANGSESFQKTDDTKKLENIYKKMQLLRILRSLGLVWLREWVLDKFFGVALYGTFSRPSSWPIKTKLRDPIDRITFYGGIGVEYQYSRAYEFLVVKVQPSNKTHYGPLKCRKPTWDDFKLLLISSNYFPFWFLIFLIRGLICKVWKILLCQK